MTVKIEVDAPRAPDAIAEDMRRFEEFERTGMGVPFEEVAQWMRSWGKPDELPVPRPRRL